jgi:hypothetical protein
VRERLVRLGHAQCLLADVHRLALAAGGVVDTIDLLIINDALGLTEGRADLTQDGIVDNQDLDLILDEWGETDPE